MKKHFTLLFLIISVFCWCSQVTYAQKPAKPNTIIDGVLQVPKTTEAPTVDGYLDPVWKNVTAYPLTKFEGGPEDSVASMKDHSANFRMMWDPAYLYVFVAVTDDSLFYGDVASPWLNDCVEMFFDGANEKASSYDTNDVQWRWVYGDSVSNHPASSGKGEWKWLRTALGYNFEVRIPKDTLGRFLPLEDDHEFGFEISNGDAEPATSRNEVLHWWTTNALTWNNPSLFGTAILSMREVSTVMNVNYATQAPTIDGEKSQGEWDAADEISLNQIEGGDTNATTVFNGIRNWKDHTAFASFLWDKDFFYAFVEVYDDSLYGSDVASPWLNDCVEMFFDGANEKASSYDANDVQWRWVYGETVAAHPAGNGKGEWMWKTTPLGYNFELKIPKDTLNGYLPLEADHEFGFEISNGDAEPGSSRNEVRHWWTDNALTWNNPSLFGTAVLKPEMTAGLSLTKQMPQRYSLEQNYPNPFNPETYISFSITEPSRVTLKVYNILGKEIATLVNGDLAKGTYKASFNASSLPSGIYLYRLEAGGKFFAKKMLLLK